MKTIKDLLSALRETTKDSYGPSRERSLSLTKLDEYELWLTKAEPNTKGYSE